MYIATEAPGGYLCIILFLLLFCNGTTCSSVDGDSFVEQCPKECRCYSTSPSNHTVDCSGKSIRSIPLGIPRNTTVLDLRNTGLSEIPPYALSHLENLNTLYLGGNDITAFNENSFAGFKALGYLNLFPIHPGMNIDYNAFPPTLFRELTSLKTLHIGGMGSGKIVQQDYTDRTIAPLHKLDELFLSYLPRRNVLYGPGYSNLSSLKTRVFKMHSSAVTQLQKEAFVWLKNCLIEKLAFIGYDINRAEPDMLSIFPRLKVLDLECSSFLSLQNEEDFICGLENNPLIETICMKNIFGRPFSQWKVSATAFKCLENTSLKALELIHNNIEEVHLYKSVGEVTHSEASSIDSSDNLETRHLFIPEDASEDLETGLIVESSLSIHLNMTNNPIHYTLFDSEEFLQRLIFLNITVTFSNDSDCPMNGSKTGLRYTLNELCEKRGTSYQIKSPNQWLSLGISLTSILGVTCSLIAAYIYRWNIKYRLFLLRHRLRRQGFIATPPGHVYISYDDGDDQWVVNELLRHLEEENELDVIIDQRDFIGGAFLAEAIVEAVDSSRKTVLVLSENFVLNSWCEFEFEMSLARGYNSVIPVMFQTVPFDAMTKSLRKFIKARGYVKWSYSQAGQRLFWKRLMDAILAVND